MFRGSATDQPPTTRRRFLKAAAATAVGAGIAGCNTSKPEDPGGTPTGTSTDDPETTTTEDPGGIQLDIRNKDIEIVWSPDMNQVEEIPDEHTANAKVTTSGGVSLKDVNVILENGEQTQQLEPDSNGNLELPANQLQEGETTAYATNGALESNQETVSKQVPGGFRADVKVQDGNHSSNWETIYAFDDTPFSQSQLDSMREGWVEETVYSGFVSDIRADKDFDDYSYVIYPNAEDGGGDARRGFFDLSEFKSADFKTALNYVTSAAKAETYNRYSRGPSAHANQMAASAEKAMGEIHPEFTMRGWGVFNHGGHGTMMFYDETSGTGWWHVDTTSDNVVKPEDAQKHRDDVWSPFTSKDAEMPGFHPGESQVDGLSYSNKSEESRDALLGMITNAVNEIGGTYDKMFITDTWMDDAYEHIRNDGEIAPVLEPLEEMVYSQIDSGEYVGLYGDLDDSRTVMGDDLGGMYDKVMTDPEVMTTEKIEGQIAG